MHEKHKHAVNDSSQEFSNESVSKVQNLNIKHIQIVPVVHDCIIHGTTDRERRLHGTRHKTDYNNVCMYLTF